MLIILVYYQVYLNTILFLVLQTDIPVMNLNWMMNHTVIVKALNILHYLNQLMNHQQ